jgi:uracil-DNA glycosylase family 4
MGTDASHAKAVKRRLESLAAAGVTSLPKTGRRPAAPAAERGAEATAAKPRGDDKDRSRALEVLRDQVSACTRCAVLAAERTQTVFGVGPADARLCFFGEAPGADEDASGIPFVGRAGQLLTKIIEACALSRDQVYILNVLKCRPPNNRPPQPDEVANCRGYFEEQFRLIQPEFICCLGTSAAQALLQTTEPIGKLRGRWFTHGTAQVLCTYHPSYLLRNPAAKRDVWEDMKILMGRMGVTLG